jgi:hypothetical protein
MRKFYNRLIEALAAWLFRPQKKHTCNCCRDRAKYEEKQKSGSARINKAPL